MREGYHDRMIRPTAGAAPMVSFVREGNRLIPIPVGSAATVPAPPERDEDPR